MKPYFSQEERDLRMKRLTESQRTYLTEELKRGKKTHYANVIGRLKGEEVASWYLIDYIDAGAVSPHLKCECGKSLRYQYVIENKITGSILKFGITHFKEHSGFPEDVAREIAQGLQRVDYELDEILMRLDGGIFPQYPELLIDELPDVYKKPLRLGLPLTREQEKKLGEWLQSRPRRLDNAGTAQTEILLNLFERKASWALSDLCKELLQQDAIGPERFKSGKLKSYPVIGQLLDQWAEEGRFERKRRDGDWVYQKRR